MDSEEIDYSLAPQLTHDLDFYLHEQNLYETNEQGLHRFTILKEIKAYLNNWAKGLIEKFHPNASIDDSKEIIALFVYGSYSLGAHSPDADIDVLCVGPKAIQVEDYFDLFPHILKNINIEYQKTKNDNNENNNTIDESMNNNNNNDNDNDNNENNDDNDNATIIHDDDIVKNINVVKSAKTPVISFNYKGIDIDLEYISMPHLEFYIPETFNPSDDKNLIGLDAERVKTLNGRRVANLVLAGFTDQTQFIIALKSLKLWTKKRGLSENALGYFGGVNMAILLKRICQENLNDTAASLLYKFFDKYLSWPYPKPITLLNLPVPTIHDFDDDVWKAEINTNDIFPVLTPAYPSMNSCRSISQGTKEIILNEFKRSKIMITNIFKGINKWSDLFSPSTFFDEYKHYLMITLASQTKQQQVEWFGLCRSRIHNGFIKYLESIPTISPRLFPKDYTIPETLVPDYPYGCCFFVGLSIHNTDDTIPLTEINLKEQVKAFIDNLVRENKIGSTIHIDALKHTRNICQIPKFVYKPQRKTVHKHKHIHSYHSTKRQKNNENE